MDCVGPVTWRGNSIFHHPIKQGALAIANSAFAIASYNNQNLLFCQQKNTEKIMNQKARKFRIKQM